jgi:hypothetical protein
LLEKSEDTKEVFSSRKLKKEKQNNDQAKNGKGTNPPILVKCLSV